MPAELVSYDCGSAWALDRNVVVLGTDDILQSVTALTHATRGLLAAIGASEARETWEDNLTGLIPMIRASICTVPNNCANDFTTKPTSKLKACSAQFAFST